MEQSFYFEYIQKYFPQLVLSIVQKLNGTNNAMTYMYRELLNPVYSVDGRWATLQGNYTRVAADVVSMDSPLPLLSRDSIEVKSGFIPKLGISIALNEKQMSDIDAMVNSGAAEAQVARALFEDTAKVIEAVYERLEYMFLLGLSTGAATADANNNVGTETRINYGFKSENKFGVSKVWSGNASTATPLDDIKRVMDKADADGNSIIAVYADDAWIDAACASEQVRSYFAFALNNVGTTASNVPVLDRTQLASVLERKYNITLNRVNRSCRTEINGVQKSVKPWKTGSATFVCDERIGDLVWTNTAEANRPVSGVSYQTADDYILVSKFSQNNPIKEFTASQARVCPVISNIDRIYTLDSTNVQA